MKEICPARISKKLTEKLQQLTLTAHNALMLSGYSRTDFIIDRDGEIWGLETNSLPGMYNISAIPLAASKIGIDYDSLCSMLIDLGIERAQKERKTFLNEMISYYP